MLLHRPCRLLLVTTALATFASACGESDDSGGGGDGGASGSSGSAGVGQGGSTAGAGGSGGAIADGGAGAPAEHLYRIVLFENPGARVLGTPLGMNAQGVVAGYSGPEGFSSTSMPLRAARADGAALLDVPEERFGFAWGVSPDGATLVGEYDFQPQAWVAGARRPLKVPPGWFSGSAKAISPAGLIVGSWGDSDDAMPPSPIGPRPCTWADPDADPVPLPTLGAAFENGQAFDVNASGRIAGNLDSADGFVPVTWASPTSAPERLPIVADASNGEARGISDSGHVVGRVSFADYSSRAFLVRAGASSAVSFEALPGAALDYAEGLGVGEDGTICGLSTASDGKIHAVLWTEAGIVDLNDRLAEPDSRVRYVSSAVAIGAGGLIAAEAVLEESVGDERRAVALLVPEE